jgi:hypothetical protein
MHHTAFLRRLVGAGIIFLLLNLSSISSARPVTASITDLKGQVEVHGRSGSPDIGSPLKGRVLNPGDTIRTGSGATLAMTLEDGSVLELGENTQIVLAALVLDEETLARQTQLKLLEGRVRATVAQDHQKKGSSFSIETPDALAEVTFSQPVIEVSYDPRTKTSVFKAYTVVLHITNYLTREARQVPRGRQAIIRKGAISIGPISEKVTSTRSSQEQQLRNTARGATSTTVPVSVGAAGTTETSTNPSPGTRPENPVRSRPVTIRIRTE